MPDFMTGPASLLSVLNGRMRKGAEIVFIGNSFRRTNSLLTEMEFRELADLTGAKDDL